MIVMTYNGYELMDNEGSWQSVINGTERKFATVPAWKIFIDKLINKE